MNTQQANSPPRSAGFYALLVGGLLIVGAIGAYAVSSGGLPGTQNSPSATVNGKQITGKTGS